MQAASHDWNRTDISFIFSESESRGSGRREGGILDKKQVSSVLFWPMLYNYTRERILIGSVFMQNYYQCPSEALEERRGGGERDVRNGFYVNEPRVHLHMDEDC